ncbi:MULTISPECIES: phage tail tube protein [unclassified Clostridioides]|uniref:phage tail tube protein n=1 Tax=unclassified Clostridioides TaxID=2635829 RepID=UPI001D0C6C3E|nr:phage tail tube protein [Clostridioides sp. ZZV14-6150]MCC0723999.1 phage tail tube protein [Clostridioides sp. ZZV14-6104]MCC0724797.1 phage tail tube protein [Clostridioides sp. ZZV14-6045]MCC0732243.1 phage tail tube protein [Clostridioides sp. ZZV14-6048]MCC0736380.1 phage tail tube protein [Clostridioides sp. ZZV14-6009]MCC0740171.1 phage tail tube protein [Clostridioides sp. ZZV14-5902]MCC0744119.1 phage tail tube protein [Clostridioides sp. ZZV14-6044]MCC0752103.1 phage tail tube p
MRARMETNRIISGTFGECWIDNRQLTSVKGLEAKIEIEKEEVKICGQVMVGQKFMGASGKGSITLFKLSSLFGEYIESMLNEGKAFRFTIISKLQDPDSYGAERIALYGCMFDDLTLADWEAGKMGEIEVPFTFEGFKYLDKIKEK